MTNENREAVKMVLGNSPSPRSSAQIAQELLKSVHLFPKELNPLLEDMAAAGEIFLWPKGKFWDREPRKEASRLILQFLAQRPVAALGKLKTELGLPLDLLQPALAELHGQDRLYLWQPGKTPYYCLLDPQVAAREVILKALADGPLNEKDLAAWVRKRLPGYQARHLKQHISLIDGLRVYPKYGKLKARVGLGPPEPGPYLKKAAQEVATVCRVLTPFQVSPAEILDALRLQLGLEPEISGLHPDEDKGEKPPLQVEQVIWGGIARLQPPGQRRALVSIRELRRSLGLPKRDFDKGVLSLALQGRASLHQHDFPGSLSRQEREELLQDEHGAYYVGIVPKEVS